MRRLIYFLSGLLVVAVMGLASLPLLLSGDFASAPLQRAVKTATGRELTLLTPPRLTFYPELALDVNGALLSNPPGMMQGTSVSMERLRARVALAPLLSRRVEVQELTFVRPRLTLVVDRQGRANWDMTTGVGQSAGEDTLASQQVELAFAPVAIENGELAFFDERSGATFQATEVNAVVTMARPDAPVDVKGSMVWNRERVDLQVSASSPAELSARGTIIEIALKSRPLTVAFSGAARIDSGLNLNGSVEARAADLRALGKWAGYPVEGSKGLKSYSTQARLQLAHNTLTLSDAKLSMDGMQAQGQVRVKLGGARPVIEASLGVDRIDTNVYTGKHSSSAQAERSADEAWSETLIDLSGLGVADANLKLRAGEIIYGDVRFADTQLEARIKKGILSAKLGQISLYGGRATGEITLDGSRKVARMSGILNAEGINGRALLSDFANLTRIKGTAATQLTLSASGASQRELVSTLKGRAQFAFTNGEIRGIDIPAMVNLVQSSIVTGWEQAGDGSTRFTRLAASFSIKEGIARNSDLELVGPLVRVTGAGTVDLPRRRLDFKVDPFAGQQAGGQLAGLAVPVIVSGPWASPKVYPDIEGILQNPQAAFDALNKLGVPGADIDITATTGKLKDQAADRVGREIEKVAKDAIGEEAAKVLGEEGTRQVKDLGGQLLDGLFGRPPSPPSE